MRCLRITARPRIANAPQSVNIHIKKQKEKLRRAKHSTLLQRQQMTVPSFKDSFTRVKLVSQFHLHQRANEVPARYF